MVGAVLPVRANHLFPPSAPFKPYGSHPFSPRVQTISILSSLIHTLCQLPFKPSSNSIHSRHSHQTRQKLHLKNIYFPSLTTSHAPCRCPMQRPWYSYCFIQTLLRIYHYIVLLGNFFNASNALYSSFIPHHKLVQILCPFPLDPRNNQSL